MQGCIVLALLASAQALTSQYDMAKQEYQGRAQAEAQQGMTHRQEGLQKVQEGVLSLEQSENVVKAHQAEIQKKMAELNNAYQGWEQLKSKVESGLDTGKQELEKIKEDDKELASATSMVETATKDVQNGAQQESLGKFETVDAASQAFGKAALLETGSAARTQAVAAAQGMAVSIRAELM
jgi:chromosome segregation ATPase